jgi:uncharacterized protein
MRQPKQFVKAIMLALIAAFALAAAFELSLASASARLSALSSVAGPNTSLAAASVSSSDRFSDGTPDFVRLDSPLDQETFRRWFVLIAEFQALRPAEQVPREIIDCAALLRYSYRNALRTHDSNWLREAQIEPPSALPSLEKYRYPFTPLGASLFRVRPGKFQVSDLKDGTFAEFADAKTLKDFNSYLVSRDIHDARPGDLLFYRQLEKDTPFHSMIFVGRSAWQPESDPTNRSDIVVYHTGPIGDALGEIRRVTVTELLQHPSPRWRPVAGNSNFLGVYRWDILRGAT